MEPHGQSPWVHRDAHKGQTSRIRGPIHPRVERVVLLVRDGLLSEKRVFARFRFAGTKVNV